jgi:2-polyprenyl-3-methyl-5-hydroxy-6-metoxy-1,4-benzoquinol methylase
MREVRRECWCDSDRLEPFSTQYLRCAGCGTLTSQAPAGVAADRDDETTADTYGQTYWLSHQREQLGLPDITERARLDLPERCLYWLRTLLAHTLPPARTLELGCSHGAFVSLLRYAGFDAMGLELSPWVVDHAQRTFRIPVLQGSIEQQDLPAQSFDAIILNDVLEHLPHPRRTLSCCVPLLKPDGVLLIQTPCYPDPKTYAQLEQEKDPFLKMLLPDEHVYLFSDRSLRQLLASLGWHTIHFTPPLFPYDMYAVASRHPRPTAPRDAIVTTLSATPAARMVLALLDLDDRLLQHQAQLAEERRTVVNMTRTLDRISADSDARLQVILDQQGTVADQQAVIQSITRQLEQLSADNDARLQLILQQQATAADQHAVIQSITRQLEQVSADNDARLQVILEQQATAADQQAVIQNLTRQLEQLSGDNEARLQIILDQQAFIREQNRLNVLEQHTFGRLLKYCRLPRT